MTNKLKHFLRRWLGLEAQHQRILSLESQVADLHYDDDDDDDNDYWDDDDDDCGDVITITEIPAHLRWLQDTLEVVGITTYHIENMSLDDQQRVENALRTALTGG